MNERSPRLGDADRVDIDVIDDVATWTTMAIAACRGAWERSGRRYARRLAETDRVRDPLDDILALVARRVVPLRPAVLRPLPADRLGPVERRFNRLDPADRYVLRRLSVLARPDVARGAHLASALQRLAEALDPADLVPPPVVPAPEPRAADGDPDDGPEAGVGGVD